MTCVLLATPSFERRPSVDYVMALSATQEALRAKGIDFIPAFLGGDPFIGEVRNIFVHMVLEKLPQVTDLFFLDDDIGWPPDKVVEFLERPQDVVAGVYPKKRDGGGWPVELETPRVERNGLLRATTVPAGFLRIKRWVLEQMAEVAPYYADPALGGGKVSVLFEAKVLDLELESLRSTDLDALSREDAIRLLRQAIGVTTGEHIMKFYGEDAWFSLRWREMGGECWVDPSIDFTHTGSRVWTGNYSKALNNMTEA